MTRTLITVILFVFCFTLQLHAQDTSVAESPEIIARDLEFRQLDGDAPIKMSSYENQTVVMVIWASWCPPCRLALADVAKLKAQSFAKTPFPILALSTEDPTKAEQDLRRQLEVIDFKEQNGWIDENSPLLKGKRVFPQIIIVKNLKVVRQFFGGNNKQTYTQFQTALKSALAN